MILSVLIFVLFVFGVCGSVDVVVALVVVVVFLCRGKKTSSVMATR